MSCGDYDLSIENTAMETQTKRHCHEDTDTLHIDVKSVGDRNGEREGDTD